MFVKHLISCIHNHILAHLLVTPLYNKYRGGKMEFQGMLMPNDLLGNTEFMRTWLLKSENILPKWDITFSVLKLLSFLKSKTYLQKTSQLQCTIIAFIKKMWCCLKTTDKIKNQGTKHNKKQSAGCFFPSQQLQNVVKQIRSNRWVNLTGF